MQHTYPIDLNAPQCRGQDSVKRHENRVLINAADQISAFINQSCRDLGLRTYIATSLAIQHGTGLDIGVITRILSYNKAGHNGITVTVPA